MKITQRCLFDDKVYEMDIPNLTSEMLQEGICRRANGDAIQDCFPELNAGEREFLLTGTPPHVWDAMFARYHDCGI